MSKNERRKFLKKSLLLAGAGTAGAVLMGGLDRSVLAVPPAASVGYINQWQVQDADCIVWADSSNSYYVKDTGIGGDLGDLIVNASLITAYGASLGAGSVGASTTTKGVQEALNSGASLVYVKNINPSGLLGVVTVGSTQSVIYEYQGALHVDSVIQASANGIVSSQGYGVGALADNSALDNSAFGYQALNGALTGPNNSAFGNGAGKSITSGQQNTLMGSGAGNLITQGSNNCAFGDGALQTITVNGDCCAFGQNALSDNTGPNNCAFGFAALLNNGSATNNCAFGYESLTTNVSGHDLSAFGYNTLAVNTASGNSAFGSTALQANVGGANNTAVGQAALLSNVSGNDNTAVGWAALEHATGNYGTAVGYAALQAATGANNSAFGVDAGYQLTTGTNNVLLGYFAGSNYTGSESNNICIGASVDGTAAESNVVRIANSSAAHYYLGSSPAAFASGDLYLVFDATTKEIHLSAVGPAS